MTTIGKITFCWNCEPPDRGPAKIRSKRAMICKPIGEEARPVGIGEEIVVDDSILRQLGSEDIVFLGRVNEELAFEI